MCCSTLFGFIVGVVLFKVFRRWAAWRFGYGAGGCGHGGGGCGGHGRAYNRWNQGGSYDRGFSNQSAANSSGFAGSAANAAGNTSSQSGRPLDDLVRGLELNQRQQEEAAPVFALIKQRLGVVGTRVDLAIGLLAADRFDPTPLVEQLGDLPEPLRRDLIDGLEHIHTILISEQREALKRELQRR
jgi:hypothetical protein